MKRLSSLIGLLVVSCLLSVTPSFAALGPNADEIVSPVAPAATCVDHVGIAEPMLLLENVRPDTACDPQLLAATELCLVSLSTLVGPAAAPTNPVSGFLAIGCSPPVRSAPS